MAIQLAPTLALFPGIDQKFFNANNNDIKLLQHKDHYSIFPSLGEEFGKFALEFGFNMKYGVYPDILDGKKMKRHNLKEFDGENVIMFTQATEQHLPAFAATLKMVNVLSIVHWLDKSILESSDVRFSTENVDAKGLPAHYIMRFQNYQIFVNGKFEFDDEPASLTAFKEVHSILFFHFHLTHYFLSLGPLQQAQGFRRIQIADFF